MVVLIQNVLKTSMSVATGGVSVATGCYVGSDRVHVGSDRVFIYRDYTETKTKITQREIRFCKTATPWDCKYRVLQGGAFGGAREELEEKQRFGASIQKNRNKYTL